ncbi:MAG: hypothetical protein M4579_003625 [Chaenotheca gracillima]|nr:MAG: hypothetical protein M4579_003625 [Chaenotheca gracillima]
MPAVEEELEGASSSPQPLTRLPFRPIRKSHIIHCSYEFWYGLYRPITPKARIIQLTPPFLDYLRADGIILPSDDDNVPQNGSTWSDQDSGVFSEDRSDSDSGYNESDDDEDPAQEFRDLHIHIKQTIAELGGKVAPKLNWSSPKDATWIAATNSMECRTPSDIYLLLKSSDFITHDLEQAFDDCVDDEEEEEKEKEDAEKKEAPGPSEGSREDDDKVRNPKSIEDINYTLVLRKWINLNPSVEFRCFVRSRHLLAMCQRDLNHFDFLFNMQESLVFRIQEFFDTQLAHTFPDEDFVFDVYIPPPHKRVWLIDVNPWAPRTDPLLFSWLELLEMAVPSGDVSGKESESASEEGNESESEKEADEEVSQRPELRLIRKDDPEAYSFNTPQFSAHKLPKDVVDASTGGPGPMREFADQWKDLLAKQEREDEEEADGQEEENAGEEEAG